VPSSDIGTPKAGVAIPQAFSFLANAGAAVPGVLRRVKIGGASRGAEALRDSIAERHVFVEAARRRSRTRVARGVNLESAKEIFPRRARCARRQARSTKQILKDHQASLRDR